MSTQSADQGAEIEQILLDFILDANADPINQPEFAAAFAAKLADFVTVWGGRTIPITHKLSSLLSKN